MIRSAGLLAVLVALMASARSFTVTGEGPAGSAGVALGFGYVLLAALMAGTIFASLGLPRLTGYLLTGLVWGPEVAGLLTPRMVDSLGLVNGVAVGLIALSAGSEINLRRLQPRLRSVALMGGLSTLFGIVSITTLSFFVSSKLPFLADLSATHRAVASLVLGVVLSSRSPAVAIAMLSETGSAGPASETMLGLVVLSDVLIVVLFAVVNALASSVFGSSGGESLGLVPALSIELFGSMIVGLLVGTAMALYARRVRTLLALFAVALCFVSAEVGTRLHLDVLIINLTAGLVLENFFNVKGEQLARELAPVSLPIFAVFFALAGAKLHLHDLHALWPFALAYALVRGTALFGGATLGAKLAKTEDVVRRYSPFGTLPQAGVSVGFAVLIGRHFPTWGAGARGLILAIVTINEIVGPIALRTALIKSGEAGRKEASGGDH